MPAPKPLTATELAALEHAFAADPTSVEACRALTEAYLSVGRFMEAMVVCKKGVKAHPGDPAQRVLLARVYAEQGKDRKALEELAAVLQAHPRDLAGNKMAGALHLRLGEREPGTAALRRAAEVAPADPEVQALLAKYGIAAQAAPVAPRVASPGGPPVAPRAAHGAAAPAGRGQAAAAVAGLPESVDVPILTPVPGSSRQQGLAYAKELADKYTTQEFTLSSTGEFRARARQRHRATIVTTVGLFAVLLLALGGWVVFNQARKARIETIDKLLKETRELVDRDGYASYQAAAQRCARILDADPDSLAGHAFLAYVDAILFAEHGAGEVAKGEAVRQVEAARRLGRHSHLIAAEAYLRFSGGDPAGALKDLKAFLDADESQSPLLTGVLGVLQMQAGDLDAARETLSRAQKANPGDARIAAMLGEQFRRRGEGYELQASGLYDYALRIQKEHVPSLLGKAQLLLDRGQYDQAAQLVQLVASPQAGASPRQQAVARVLRGSLLFAQGKGAEGQAEEDAAAKLDPSNADVPYLVGRRKLREGDAAGAVDAFQRALGMDPRRMVFYIDLTRALLQKEGGAKQAVDVLKKAVTRLGEGPRLALLLGDAFRAQGDADLARGQYEKAIQLGRPYPDARVALARLFRAQNNIPGALVELNQAVDEYGQGGTGGAAQAFVEMAETERARGARKELLLDLYEKALQRDPASCDALWGAGKLGMELRRSTDQARQRLEGYARVCPRAGHAEEASRLAAGK
ncbi:MAG TPA: tetratricopeptide repeat protein [Anaeromyxobacteraceae bacterium]|nr:tetratricopeptide repeat protein [Anaeromyxobacteraceae bacterium]